MSDTKTELKAQDTATPEGQRLIEAWVRVQKAHLQAERALHDAVRNLNETRTALALWMLPGDAQIGEKISVWHGDSLIQVELLGITPYETRVTIRKRGRSLSV